MDDSPQNLAETIRDIVASDAMRDEIDGRRFAIVPPGYKVEDLHRFQGEPARKRGHVTLSDADSFIAYVMHHATEPTTIYGDDEKLAFVAVLNEHGVIRAGWRDHVAWLQLKFSAQWKRWSAANGKAFTQQEFALFIENGIPDIVEPAGTVLMDVTRNLSATKKVSYQSGLRLENGDMQLSYIEETDANVKGQVTIPTMFKLGIPVVVGGIVYAIDVRFRYRIQDAKLALYYDLVRPDRIVEDVYAENAKLIGDRVNCMVLRGNPGDLSGQ